MRPAGLNPLFAPANALPGVGPKIAPLLDRLLGVSGRGARVIDVLMHLPQSAIDRRARPKIRDAVLDTIVTLEIVVAEHRAPKNGAGPYRVLVEDETGDVQLVFFRANFGWVEKSLPLGAKRWVSGKLELWDGHRQIVHPDRVVDEAGLARMSLFEPVYPLTEGLFPRVLARAAAGALERLPDLDEWGDPARGRPRFGEALRMLHHPGSMADLGPDAPARRRLAFDELLANQLALLMMRARMRDIGGRATTGDGRMTSAIEAALPFSLTAAQRAALGEIAADQAREKRMLRLLQGDVGSGKTIVALLAMARAVEAGRQAALMAPTEILVAQHHERLSPLAEAAGIKLGRLTGRDSAARRTKTLEALAEGSIDIVVGTHALFQDAVAFHDLGLAVIDEQHRFGVHQRLALGQKGADVDILVMTATPIPRTLVLTFFGDMDVSVLREKPPGRRPVDTRAVTLDRLDEVVSAVGRTIADGSRVYWICPLVEDSEDLDLAAATGRFEDLRRLFGDRVALVHGRMKPREKDEAMEAFRRGDARILVATTVVEVGVDVPEANIMVIEHAERFGLAQLHQLRGRVGRGAAQSTCLLLFKKPLGEVAGARLSIMRETEDGFRIAEEDLKLRGEGEILGVRQSGAPGFRVAVLEAHGDLLAEAREEADRIFKSDPLLESQRGKALRMLLHLFERDEAVRLLDAG